MSAEERGSAAVLLLAVVGVAAVVGMLISDIGALLAARSRGAGAADAAALAAAPVTFLPFGATGTPLQEAAVFAAANGARLVWCSCSVDRSFRAREVAVKVRVEVDTLLLGHRSVVAQGRARFDPRRLGIAPGSALADALPLR